jgi:hypothetical protein
VLSPAAPGDGADPAPLCPTIEKAWISELAAFTYASTMQIYFIIAYLLGKAMRAGFSEDSGSIIETQDALDHEHLGTTRACVQTIAVKKDKFSGSIRSRMEALDSTQSYKVEC